MYSNEIQSDADADARCGYTLRNLRSQNKVVVYLRLKTNVNLNQN